MFKIVKIFKYLFCNNTILIILITPPDSSVYIYSKEAYFLNLPLLMLRP